MDFDFTEEQEMLRDTIKKFCQKELTRNKNGTEGRRLGFLLGLKFLTVIPLPPRRQATAEETGQSVVYFPLVGLLLGLFLVGIDRLLGLALPASVTNVLLVIVMAAITGALHLDGLADTFDGVMLRTSREE